MTTAVSLPDPLFEAADRLAQELGKSRSQLYAEALREYLERHRDENITARLNEICAAEPKLAELDPVPPCSTDPCPKKNGRLRRGEVWWANLPDPVGSGWGYRRPAVIVQADRFNASRIKTVIVAAISFNSRTQAAPGNVRLPIRTSGLLRDSVSNVTQLLHGRQRPLVAACQPPPPVQAP